MAESLEGSALLTMVSLLCSLWTWLSSTILRSTFLGVRGSSMPETQQGFRKRV